MSKKKRAGRPTVSESVKRKPRFLVLLNDAEFGLVQQAAGDKVSTWARETLLRAAKRGARQN
jgi:hypothetical protein